MKDRQIHIVEAMQVVQQSHCRRIRRYSRHKIKIHRYTDTLSDSPFLNVIVREPSMGLNRPLHVASPLCATRYTSAEPSGTGPPGRATSWSMAPMPMAALFRLPCTVWPAFSYTKHRYRSSLLDAWPWCRRPTK